MKNPLPRLRQLLVVLGESPKARRPREDALHHPLADGTIRPGRRHSGSSLANTGNAQNIIGLTQVDGEADDFEFDEID